MHFFGIFYHKKYTIATFLVCVLVVRLNKRIIQLPAMITFYSFGIWTVTVYFS